MLDDAAGLDGGCFTKVTDRKLFVIGPQEPRFASRQINRANPAEALRCSPDAPVYGGSPSRCCLAPMRLVCETASTTRTSRLRSWPWSLHSAIREVSRDQQSRSRLALRPVLQVANCAPADLPSACEIAANDFAGAEVRSGPELPPGTECDEGGLPPRVRRSRGGGRSSVSNSIGKARAAGPARPAIRNREPTTRVKVRGGRDRSCLSSCPRGGRCPCCMLVWIWVANELTCA